MTEKEFIELAKSKGAREKNIKQYLIDFYELKEKKVIDIELDEYLVDMIMNLQQKEDDNSDDVVSLD